jgi:hypothetical protein
VPLRGSNGSHVSRAIRTAEERVKIHNTFVTAGSGNQTAPSCGNRKLLFNMIQDGLLRGKTKTEDYFD